MVHRMNSVEEFPSAGEKTFRRKVKAEFDDSGEFLRKRRKLDFSQKEKNEGGSVFGVLEYNPLREPSPLGLKLNKSPSFLDLIQMKLSQQRTAPLSKTLPRKEKAASSDNNNTKHKASNFHATLLKIGAWEYRSRYEGDLVAKCYFAKHKLVWEVLDGGLKNKIEIQWSDIMGIKANYPDNEPETLHVVLARPPLFFRELNPLPRTHTLWQATTDFTAGHASLHRQHFLQFSRGTLGKHFEKLIQCDPRLRFLSQQPKIELDSPYFQQPRVSMFGDQSDPELGFELNTEGRFSFSSIRDTVSVSGLSSSDFENQNPICSLTETSQKSPQLIQGDVSSRYNDDDAEGHKLLNQINLPDLVPSMSVGDLLNQIGDCISEQMRTENNNLSIDEPQKLEILEITQYLLNDSQIFTSSDEQSIMAKVNSLCNLLHKEDTGVHNAQVSSENKRVGDTQHANQLCENPTAKSLHAVGCETGVGNDSEQGTTMSRKDSFGELLLHLPRIASLPQFLISENSAIPGR